MLWQRKTEAVCTTLCRKFKPVFSSAEICDFTWYDSKPFWEHGSDLFAYMTHFASEVKHDLL